VLEGLAFIIINLDIVVLIFRLAILLGLIIEVLTILLVLDLNIFSIKVLSFRDKDTKERNKTRRL